MVRRALISVSEKRGVVELGKALVELGFEILSTGGTASALALAGVPVTQVSAFTGAPEILDGRVKTLHPKIHGGLLGRATPAHEAEMAANDISPIELVVVNLYPFEATIAKPTTTATSTAGCTRFARCVIPMQPPWVDSEAFLVGQHELYSLTH